jgi:hypothetical protein
MFVTNKIVKPPNEILVGYKIVNNECEEIKERIVNIYKLLAVTID